MKKTIVLILSILTSPFCNAECWKIGDLKGYSSRAGSEYKISEDSFTGKTFMVQISGATSAVVPNDLTCKEVSSTSLVCISSEKNRGVVETWSIDPKNGVALYTKSVSGYNIFDGGNLFIGKIIGTCK